MQADWTEKYRPRALAQIFGNESSVQMIRLWGESWKKGTPRSRALILQGEPGVGKTSAALALAGDMGWDHIEMNASDHRNAASIRRVAGLGAVNQTFAADGEFLSSSKGRRKLVILDEADNLFGREDYGGAKAIVDVIREAKQPIILIANDYNDLARKAPALKSLAQRAVFRRLSARTIVAVLKHIVSKEGIHVADATLSGIAENAGGDVRAAINDLQMMVEGRSSIGVEDSATLGKRNQLKELSSALNAMFGSRTARGARDATLDLDEIPDDLEKWIEESIPMEFRDPEDMAAAFEALARSDIYLGRTRALQHYGLWSYAKEIMTGGVALSRKRSQRPSNPEYRFPGYFILLSRAKGPRASRDSISAKLAAHLHTSRKCVSESTLPMLSVMVRNDKQLLRKLTDELQLDEGDVAYLLGLEPSSVEVQRIMASAMPADDSDKQAKRSKGTRPGRGLANY